MTHLLILNLSRIILIFIPEPTITQTTFRYSVLESGVFLNKGHNELAETIIYNSERLETVLVYEQFKKKDKYET